MYVTGLTDSMASVLRLSIHGWIPVTIIEYDSVCPSQVYSNTSGSCGEDEAKYLLIGIEPFH